MGFDTNSEDQPLVNVHKKTTQVNLWLAVGVAVFFLISAFVVIHHSRSNEPDAATPPPEARPAGP
jgi:peptidoglycan/LPS O-acetylase OafA/YrhL